MRKKTPFTAKEIKFFRELQKQKIPFLIVGLSAAVLQGASVVTQDIDLWFKDLADPRFQKVVRKLGGFYVPPMGLNPPMIGGKGFELLDLVTSVHGLKDFSTEYRAAKKFKIGALALRILSLDKIIKSKKFLGRKKDKAVLPVLKDVQKILKAVGRKNMPHK